MIWVWAALSWAAIGTIFSLALCSKYEKVQRPLSRSSLVRLVPHDKEAS